MRLIRNLTLTKFTGLFILIVIVTKVISNEDWKNNRQIIGGDVRGYYAYLPALFINNDLKFKDLETYKLETPGYQVWTMEADDGTRFIKYTCGMSIMYSPFFFVANDWAESLGAKPDGFSWPYRVALIISSLFYLLLGIVFLSKFLLRFFSDHAVAITLLILFLGTNLFQYETKHLTYSHGYSFMLISLFLYSTVAWFDHYKIKWAIWMGVSAGLMVLIRPIDILFVSFILLFGIVSFIGLKKRLHTIWKHKWHAVVFMVCAFLMILPQLLYFKHISGSYIFYSYNEESFFFLSPHLYDSVFSFRNGWLIYSPIMVFSVIGLFFVRRYGQYLSTFTLFSSIIYFYVIASWWCWWYVGFGNRAFINLYPILAISICALVHYLDTRKFYLRWTFNTMVVGLMILNAFQSFQFENGIIHWGYMSKEAYADAWGRTHVSQLQSLYLHVPDLQEAKKGRDIVSVPDVKVIRSISTSFEKTSPSDSTYHPHVQANHAYTGSKALYFPKLSEYIVQTTFDVPENVSHISISYNTKRSGPVLAVIEGVDQQYNFLSGDIMEINDGWEKMELFAKLPKDRPKTIRFFVWNKGLEELLIDDLKIQLLDFRYKTVEY